MLLFALLRFADLDLLGLLIRLDLRFEDRRDLERLLDLGVRLLREALRRVERRRLELRDDLFGAFGVRARRLEDLRLELRIFEAFGVRLRRADRIRLLPLELRRLDAFGVRLRRAVRFCFLTEPGFDSERARFLIPISLFLFSSIIFLYSSRPVAQLW